MNAELVTARHLARKAVIYIRQSSPHQVLANQESLRLQYALRQRACELGWHEATIEVIDADLGLSGAAAEHRRGFKELIARVTLGEVGIVLSSEVTRLARNCSDWYPLLDLCGYRACLIADRDGVYDPGSLNGRLLLGLKGTMSAVELHLLRGRLTAGLLSKAARGELGLALPAGLERDADGRVTKDPDREVQDRIALVFTTFLEQGSVSRVMKSFKSRQLTVPRRGRFGEVAWRAPTTGMLGGILKNPAYAGAFVYGRTRSCHRHYANGKLVTTRCPRSEWQIVVQGKYPAYLDWDSFERIQAMLRDNYAEYVRNKTRGVPRDGAALLQGIVWCGQCGHKMVVQYKAGNRYVCNHLHATRGEPVCQHLPADPIDAEVVAAFFAAVTPAELEAWAQAHDARRQAEAALDRAGRLQVERLRYQAALAERQFHRIDPDNRLVAAELERRWELALRELRQAEDALARHRAARAKPEALSAEDRARFLTLGPQLPALWRQLDMTRERKKALLRSLIDKVVLRRMAADRISIRIVWRGGEISALEIEVAVYTHRVLARGVEMEARLLALARQGVDDATIAAQLTREGYRSARCDHVSADTVRHVRHQHRVLRDWRRAHPRHVPGWLTMAELARRLRVSRDWLERRIRNGTIAIAHDAASGRLLFPDTDVTLAHFQELKAGLVDHLDYLPSTAQ
jgi:DNA invertase Pin-like site-specific DNA recombinase